MTAAFACAGCGVPQMVGDTANAVMSPVASIAQSASYGVASASNSAASIARTTSIQVGSAARDSSANLANSISTTRQVADAAAPSVSYPPSLTADQKAAIEKGKTADQPDLPMLSDEVLAKLTEDQRGLQKAAQKVALTAPVGETIFWDNEGRSGTVLVKDEHKMGESVCRSFEQSVTIDGVDEKGHGIACKDTDSGRWALAF
jgi:surface antigen